MELSGPTLLGRRGYRSAIGARDRQSARPAENTGITAAERAEIEVHCRRAGVGQRNGPASLEARDIECTDAWSELQDADSAHVNGAIGKRVGVIELDGAGYKVGIASVSVRVQEKRAVAVHRQASAVDAGA